MSRARCDPRSSGWWRYVKTMIRKYDSVAVEDAKTELERLELQAVARAIEHTATLKTGPERLKLVELVLRKRSHNIAGAAMVLHISEHTAVNWHGDFIKAVARGFFGDKLKRANGKEKSHMVIKIKLDPGAYMPSKAYEYDAGYDLKATESFTVPAGGSYTTDTGVHMAVPAGYCGLLVSKSGLNVKHDITSTGLIDSGFRGSLRVKLYNDSKWDYEFHAGDKISQIVILPAPETELEAVSELNESERGERGYGSSGK